MGFTGKRKKYVVACSVLVFLVILSSCGNEKKDITSPELTKKTYAILTGQLGCKKDTEYLLDSEPDRSRTVQHSEGMQLAVNEDCMEYTFYGDTLYLKHINACFNCCPVEIYVEAVSSGDTIYLIENEKEAQCHCLCLFDLDIAVCEINAGEYTIVVKELYLTDKDELLVFDVDLSTNPEGKFCVKRDHYPW